MYHTTGILHTIQYNAQRARARLAATGGKGFANAESKVRASNKERQLRKSRIKKDIKQQKQTYKN